MVKLVFCVRKRADLDFEHFQQRWLHGHGDLVKSLREQLPMMRRYVQSHLIPGPASDALRASRGAGEPFDGITEVWWDSEDDLAAAMKSRDGLEAGRILLEDEGSFIDLQGSSLFLTEEHEIF